MVDMEFKVGDRVRCIKEYSIVPIGCVGSVKENDKHGHTIGVEWDKNISGHDGNGFFNGKDGFCYFIPTRNITKITEQKHSTIVIQTDGTITTATLRQGKEVIRTATAKLNPADTFDRAIGAKLALERLMPVAKAVKPVEVKPVEKAEPIKLYCVKDYMPGTWMTKGKIYSLTCDYRMTYDDGHVGVSDTSLNNFFASRQPWHEHLVPLVSRPAKVGEWIYVTATDGHGKDKGVYQVTRLADYNDRWVFVDKQNCIRYDQYLVLENYAPETE